MERFAHGLGPKRTLQALRKRSFAQRRHLSGICMRAWEQYAGSQHCCLRIRRGLSPAFDRRVPHNEELVSACASTNLATTIGPGAHNLVNITVSWVLSKLLS